MKQLLIAIAAVVLVGCGPSVDIHQAGRDGNIEAVKTYLTAGGDVNAKDEDGWTPLYYATTKEIAELLISKGADVNARDKFDETPLSVAIKLNYTEIVDLLRKNGAKTFQPEMLQGNLLGYRHIYLEAMDGNIEGVKALLAGGVSVDSMGAFVGTPLSAAAEEGHKDMVELLIANKANVNALTQDPLGHGGQTPLDLAILKIYDSRDYKGTIEILRKHGGKTSEELKAEGK